jgi:hypothetical protein
MENKKEKRKVGKNGEKEERIKETKMNERK